MHRVDCTADRHASQILAILNEAIANSTALWDYQPRSPEAMAAWFAAKRAGGFPVIGFEADDGTLAAFGSWGAFRAFPAYKYTVEHSVYVQAARRGQGLGRRVLQALLDEAARRGDVHVMVGAIEARNTASLALHDAMGFERVGLMPQVGYKFGAWLDLALVQKVLAAPADPRDG